MANRRRRLSEAQLQALVALSADGARTAPNISANWLVRQGPHIIAMVRWATVHALAKAGYISGTDQAGAYRITDAGRAARAEAEATTKSGAE